MDDNKQAHPYRESATAARWVCIACHRFLSVFGGSCPQCRVDLLDLSRPDVREEVGQWVEKILYRRMMREELVLVGISTAASVVSGWALSLKFYDWLEDGGGRLPFVLGMGIGIAVYAVLQRVYLKIRPEAGIATYAERRRRLARSLGRDSTVLQGHTEVPATALAPDASRIDPEVTELDQLLRRLGAKLDG